MSRPVLASGTVSFPACSSDSSPGCSITNLILETKHTKVYRGRKKLTLDFFVVKSVSLTQKERAINEVCAQVTGCCRSHCLHSTQQLFCRGAPSTSSSMIAYSASRNGEATAAGNVLNTCMQ